MHKKRRFSDIDLDQVTEHRARRMAERLLERNQSGTVKLKEKRPEDKAKVGKRIPDIRY